MAPEVALAVDAVVLDIEGTTTPIEFVHTTLFGFVREQLSDFVAARRDQPDVARALARLADEHAAEPDPTRPPAPDEAWVRWLMDRDRKSTGLKELQGLIWRDGYHGGALRSVVYPDVAPALERWHHAGLTVAIYSSGSIAAQQLLFARSDHGDLTRWIARYFDTTTGGKREIASYARIAAALAIAPDRIAFVSDVVEELAAADRAGLRAVLALRPGNPPVADGHGFAAVASFDALALGR